MTAPPRHAGGLEHRGLVYDGTEDLVRGALPLVRAALADGDAVRLLVDRVTARGLREALGDDAERVTFDPPAVSTGDEFVLRLRAWARPDRRTFVLGQYTATPLDGAQCAFTEDAIALTCGDLPLTVLCTCATDASPELVDVARRSHAVLVVDGVAAPNPGHRAPPDRTAVTGPVWGTPVVRTTFRDTGDLRRLRERVRRAAAGAGLEGLDAHLAVLAVHEAALLACRTGEGRDADLAVTAVHPEGAASAGDGGIAVGGPADDDAGDGPVGGPADCVLEVSAAPGVLHTVVRAPGAATGGGDPLAALRPFCRHADLAEEGRDRVVRVLCVAETGRPGPV